MCMAHDYDDWTLFRSQERRANKEHRCGECDRTISRGERYRYSAGLIENYWQDFRQCLQCLAASDWLIVVCEGWLFDAIEEDLANHVDGDESYLCTPPLRKLVEWMRADWRDESGDLRSVEAVHALTAEAIAAYREQFAAATA